MNKDMKRMNGYFKKKTKYEAIRGIGKRDMPSYPTTMLKNKKNLCISLNAGRSTDCFDNNLAPQPQGQLDGNRQSEHHVTLRRRDMCTCENIYIQKKTGKNTFSNHNLNTNITKDEHVAHVYHLESPTCMTSGLPSKPATIRFKHSMRIFKEERHITVAKMITPFKIYFYIDGVFEA
jgi:hypothetical protein